MLEEALETLVRRASDLDAGADLTRAREEFCARTGDFEPGERWYEARIRFFLDWYVTEWRASDGSSAAERSARTQGESVMASALRESSRGLFEVLEVAEDGRLRLAERVGGARFWVAASHTPQGLEPVRVRDMFDGRLLVLDRRIVLMPGLIFHPAEAHAPLEQLLVRAREARIPRGDLLDGLLRMRMRLDRFTSMRARHIYRWEALGDRTILSAAWARR